MSIRWFGAALLAAAGIAALLATASAQDIVRDADGSTGVLTGAQASQLATVASACWTHGLGSAQGALIERGTGADAGNVYIAVSGTPILSRADAEALLLSGGTLLPGRRARVVERCQVTVAAHLTALSQLAQAFWSGPVSTLQSMTFVRQGGSVRVTRTVGQTTQAVADAVTDSENGATIVPRGVVE